MEYFIILDESIFAKIDKVPAPYVFVHTKIYYNHMLKMRILSVFTHYRKT